MIITFCGHSDFEKVKGDEKRLLNHIEKVANNEQVDFYLGGYGRFDDFALLCARLYKKEHLDAKLIFVTPYLSKGFNEKKEILTKTYDLILYPQLENIPQRLAIIKRNEWMIENADYVFAYVKRHYGGAYRALLHARKRKKPYINLFQGNYELY